MIYVASSWRNERQPEVVAVLRANGHEVYDFRHPLEGNDGFSWSSIDPNWKEWTPAQFRDALEHPIAQAGFKLDFDAMDKAERCVLVLPSGRSAHLEAGYMLGKGKPVDVLLCACEPELMYLLTEQIGDYWGERTLHVDALELLRKLEGEA